MVSGANPATTIMAESRIRVSQIGEHLPFKPSPATRWRWALRGIRGVRLETLKIGRVRYTSVEALHRFIAAVTESSQQSLHGREAESETRPESTERRLKASGLR